MKSLEENNQILKIKRIVADYLWETLNDESRYFNDQYANKIQLNTKLIATEKYINGIEYFMNEYSHNDSKPRIYVASDEHNIINQLQYLRPNWEFVQFSQTYLQSYGHEQRRFNHLSAHNKLESTRILLTDMEVLSRVKYVVCTFSSNVCRFVQILRKQEPNTVLSLDQEWYPL